MKTITGTRLTRCEWQAIDNAIAHLAMHYADKISPEDLADKFQIPIKKLQCGVHKRTGQTVHEHLLVIRLNKAKDLLAEDEPLKQIAITIGCKNASQFGQFFKKYTGLTPTQYRYQSENT